MNAWWLLWPTLVGTVLIIFIVMIFLYWLNKTQKELEWMDNRRLKICVRHVPRIAQKGK